MNNGYYSIWKTTMHAVLKRVNDLNESLLIPGQVHTIVQMIHYPYNPAMNGAVTDEWIGIVKVSTPPQTNHYFDPPIPKLDLK